MQDILGAYLLEVEKQFNKKIEKRVVELQKENKTLSYEEALKRAKKEIETFETISDIVDDVCSKPVCSENESDFITVFGSLLFKGKG